MSPAPSDRFKRIFAADTGISRLLIAFGMLIMGGGMLRGIGLESSGYELMAKAFPLQCWALLCIAIGCLEIYGVFGRVPYIARLVFCVVGMWAWVVIALSQNAHAPTPARLLLVLPAVVELWVLVKVVLCGPREDRL